MPKQTLKFTISYNSAVDDAALTRDNERFQIVAVMFYRTPVTMHPWKSGDRRGMTYAVPDDDRYFNFIEAVRQIISATSSGTDLAFGSDGSISDVEYAAALVDFDWRRESTAETVARGKN